MFGPFLESVGASDIRAFEEGQLKDMQEQYKARMKLQQHRSNLEVRTSMYDTAEWCMVLSCICKQVEAIVCESEKWTDMLAGLPLLPLPCHYILLVLCCCYYSPRDSIKLLYYHYCCCYYYRYVTLTTTATATTTILPLLLSYHYCLYYY